MFSSRDDASYRWMSEVNEQIMGILTTFLNEENESSATIVCAISTLGCFLYGDVKQNGYDNAYLSVLYLSASFYAMCIMNVSESVLWAILCMNTNNICPLLMLCVFLNVSESVLWALLCINTNNSCPLDDVCILNFSERALLCDRDSCMYLPLMALVLPTYCMFET